MVCRDAKLQHKATWLVCSVEGLHVLLYSLVRNSSERLIAVSGSARPRAVEVYLHGLIHCGLRWQDGKSGPDSYLSRGWWAV